METQIIRRDPVTTHLRVPIQGSRTEQGLGDALDRLIDVARGFPASLGGEDDDEAPRFEVVTFHGDKRWLSERRFFERAARHPALHDKIARYVDAVSPASWSSDPFRGTGFWTSMLTPAGSLAVVPLALADRKNVDVAIRHLRGVDLDHETFHRSFITELARRHGFGDEVMRLLAFRAVDGQGQHGRDDLRWLMERGGLADVLDLDSFAALVDRESKRTSYRALYVANAGNALFPDRERFERWLRFFEGRGLVFDEQHRALWEREPYPARPWKEEWEQAASCTDRDD